MELSREVQTLTQEGEYMLGQITVAHAADLSFAQGKVGWKNRLEGEEAKAAFAQEIAGTVEAVTKPNTADCGDERNIIAFEDGGPIDRVAYRLFGGIGLATTKALVAANASVIKDATDMWDAYEKTFALLTDLNYEDAGHEGCKARQEVEHSVTQEYDDAAIHGIAGAFGVSEEVITQIDMTRNDRVASGFYGTWDGAKQEAFLKEHAPQNYAYLNVDPADKLTAGHYGSGFVAVLPEGMSARSDGRAFINTISLMTELSEKLGGSTEEKARIYAAFIDDMLRVGGIVVEPGFPAFVAKAA